MVTNANWLCSCSLRGPVGIWTWSFWWLTLRNLAPFLSHCQWHMKKKNKKTTSGKQMRGTERWVTHSYSPVFRHTHGEPTPWRCIWESDERQRLDDNALRTTQWQAALLASGVGGWLLIRWCQREQCLLRLYGTWCWLDRKGHQMLVMIIHSWSPHREISATESVKFHAGYVSAWRLDVCMSPGDLYIYRWKHKKVSEY